MLTAFNSLFCVGKNYTCIYISHLFEIREKIIYYNKIVLKLFSDYNIAGDNLKKRGRIWYIRAFSAFKILGWQLSNCGFF